jgi:hypothetical protein
MDIPKGSYDSPGPCWIKVVTSDGTVLKPRIKCQCGHICYIGLHHVHSDGTVTASFFDSTESSFVHNGKTYSHTPGCGFHEHLRLLDYDLGDFPPEEI